MWGSCLTGRRQTAAYEYPICSHYNQALPHLSQVGQVKHPSPHLAHGPITTLSLSFICEQVTPWPRLLETQSLQLEWQESRHDLHGSSLPKSIIQGALAPYFTVEELRSEGGYRRPVQRLELQRPWLKSLHPCVASVPQV